MKTDEKGPIASGPARQILRILAVLALLPPILAFGALAGLGAAVILALVAVQRALVWAMGDEGFKPLDL